jgi:uncharacterized protein
MTSPVRLCRFAALAVLLAVGLLPAKDWKTLKPTGYVNDFAGVVDPENKAAVEAYCGQVEKATGAQMTFVTIASLEGEAIEDVANEIFRNFGIGQKGKDNGILLLLVSGDHRFRLEIGHGLEPILPDGLDGQILLDMRPGLRAGQYGAALMEAAQRIGGILAQDKGVTIPIGVPRREVPREHPVYSIPWPMILGGLVLLFFLFRGGGSGGNFTGSLLGGLLGGMMGGGGRRYGGGGGYGGFGGSDGGGGGFGGFGGGDSGGGGASSDW